MKEKWFMDLIALVLVMIIVTISEILSRKRRNSRKYLTGLLKSQFYYFLTYILTIIIVIIFVRHPVPIIIDAVATLLIIIQIHHFFTSFLLHSKISHNFNSKFDIAILGLIVSKTQYFINHYVKGMLNKAQKRLLTN